MRRTHTLNIALGTLPPTEFRIFTAGQVETSKGVFTFDDQAAQSVMAAARDQGNELMVDYDHGALHGQPADPATYGKAAGWFDLELRNGELWAVNVRWTPPAAEALSNKEWRYMSPAFETDADGRIVSLMNVALTNLPATKHLTPLMAASETYGESMTPEQFSAIAEALGLGADSNIEDVLATIAAMMGKVQDAMAGADPAKDAPADPAADPAAPAAAAQSAPPPEQAAVAASLLTLSGKETLGAALEDVRVWRTAYLEQEATRAKLAVERAALENTERRSLVAKLIASGAERPATAFKDPTQKPDRLVLCARLMNEPIAELRTRTAIMTASSVQAEIKHPVSAGPELSAREIAMCAELKVDPKAYAANKAAFTKKA